MACQEKGKAQEDATGPLSGTRFDDVWNEGMQIAGKGDVAVVNPGYGTGGRYVCRVRSQTDQRTLYTVRNTAGKGWTCSCPMYAKGRKICKHIVSAFVYLSESQGGKHNMTRGGKDLEIPPPRWCPGCGSTDCTKKEERPLSRMQHSKKYRDQSLICRCNSCGRTFADRPGFVGRHYSERVILKVLTLVARKMSPLDAATTANEDYGTNVSERTARRWVSVYADMVFAYAKGLRINEGGEGISVDEKRFTFRGEDWWVYTVTCLKTRLTIAVHFYNVKLGYDATHLFEMVAKRISAPLLLISDGLGGYKLGYKNVFKTDPPTTLYIPDASVNGVHVNNNISERSNGYLAEHIGCARGFNSAEPGRIKLCIIHKDFLRPHGGLSGMTPAEKAGIHIPGPNKLHTLIRCAAASALAHT